MWCIDNKRITSKQCTVIWHLDDIKISHIDKNVVTKVLDLLSDEFVKEAPLGMQIDYTQKKKLQIAMYDHIQNMLPYIYGGTITPAANYLFSVNQEAQKIHLKLL